MRAVTRQTGLSAAVIRAWERRYRAIEPLRTEGNTRRYSHEDVQRLELLRDAVSLGHSISAIAGASNEALRKLTGDARRRSETGAESLTESYVAALMSWDTSRSAALLARAAAARSPRDQVLSVAAPILRRIGELWAAGEMSISHEHTASAQLRGMLAAALRVREAPRGAPRVLFGTPPGHRHELGAMMAAVLAAHVGLRVAYLGVDLPLDEFSRSGKQMSADVVVIALSHWPEPEAGGHPGVKVGVAQLATERSVWVGGIPTDLSELAELPGVRVFGSLEEFELAARQLAGT